MNIQILDRAKTDLVEGYRFYESKEKGLGHYFLASLLAEIESLRLFGGLHTKTYRHFYRALTKRFPFAIFYTLDEEAVKIHAVVDCRRRPSWIRKHLKE